MEVINTKNASYPLFALPVISWVVLLMVYGVAPVSWEGLKLISVVITFSSCLVGLFIKHLWKWRIFRGWLVLVPNLNGKWEGNMTSDYKDAVNPISTTITIHQKLNKIVCDLKTGESHSKSLIAGFLIDDDRKEICLIYTYSNQPDNKHRNHSEIHNGTAGLTLQEDRSLSGHYWTDRNTKGDITMTKVRV